MILKNTIITLCLIVPSFLSCMDQALIIKTNAHKNHPVTKARQAIYAEFKQEHGYSPYEKAIEKIIKPQPKHTIAHVSQVTPIEIPNIESTQDNKITTMPLEATVDIITTNTKPKPIKNKQLRAAVNQIKEQQKKSTTPVVSTKKQPLSKKNKQNKQTPIVVTPQNTQSTNINKDAQKREDILQALYKLHKVSTENELKAQFALECRENNSPGQSGLLISENCVWTYLLKNNSLQFFHEPYSAGNFLASIIKNNK